MNKILIALLLIPTLLFSQDKTSVPVKDGKIFYEFIDSLPLTKAQIHLRSEQWFANDFRSKNDVVQLDDKESGELIGKGIILVGTKGWIMNGEMACRTTIKVSSRDGKYRIQFYDFISIPSYGPESPVYVPETKSAKRFIDSLSVSVNSTYASFKKAIATNESF